jgi:Fe-S oxidoreductase/nitrate reductase gamma subunit
LLIDLGAIEINHYLFVENLEFLVYLLIPLVALIFLFGLYRQIKIWFHGYGFFRALKERSLREGLSALVKYGILQRKVIKTWIGSTIHVPIYVGSLILLIGTILRFLEYDVTYKLAGFRFLTDFTYLVYKSALNIGGILLVTGCVIAWIRRAYKRDEIPTVLGDHLVLSCLFLIGVTGFLLDGISTLSYRMGWVDGFDFVGYAIASYIQKTGLEEAFFTAYPYIWLSHMLLALFSLAAIPYTKLFHLVAGGLFNTFFARSEPLSALKPVEDLEKRLETTTYVGAEKVADLSWKERLDYDSCVFCARCHNNCPANLSGKPLSPMYMILEMRKVMKKGEEAKVITEKNIPEVFWSCTTCGACVEQCPLLIHHVETIIDVRRWMMSVNQAVAVELLQLSSNIRRAMNPYGLDPYSKIEFIQKLSEEQGIEIAEEGKEYDVIYWIGCSTALDPALRPIAYAVVKLLKSADLKAALLPEEGCCGDPVRRTGDELLFNENILQIGEFLKKYNFKTLLVGCPHGYNSFKYEYPQFGYNFHVEHYTEFFARLIKEGRLKLKPQERVKLTYHDPCYLARWNPITQEPRLLLRKTGIDLVEMKRSGERTFCCGGGGGGAFFDIKIGERISKVRISEAKKTGVNTVAVACPFCNMMLKSEAQIVGMEVKDIAVILAEALE